MNTIDELTKNHLNYHSVKSVTMKINSALLDMKSFSHNCQRYFKLQNISVISVKWIQVFCN